MFQSFKTYLKLIGLFTTCLIIFALVVFASIWFIAIFVVVVAVAAVSGISLKVKRQGQHIGSIRNGKFIPK